MSRGQGAKVLWTRGAYDYGPRTSLLLKTADLPAPMAIFTSVVKYCVYPEIYRFIGINRVVRYIFGNI